MPYNPDDDPLVRKGNLRRDSFGAASRDVSANGASPAVDVEIIPYAAAVLAGSTGNLVVVPVKNEDDDSVTFTDVPVGFMPPFRVRMVKAATTCTVFTVE